MRDPSFFTGLDLWAIYHQHQYHSQFASKSPKFPANSDQRLNIRAQHEGLESCLKGAPLMRDNTEHEPTQVFINVSIVKNPSAFKIVHINDPFSYVAAENEPGRCC